MPSKMKLSELAKLKEDLDAFIKFDGISSALNDLNEIAVGLAPKNPDSDISDFFLGIGDFTNLVRNLIATEAAKIHNLKKSIDSKINEMSSKYFAANYQMELVLDEEGERRTRNKAFGDEAREILTKRLRLYSDWHYPALEIGPGTGVWTEELVGNDPLYLLDVRKSYLDETIAKFNPTYQKRLRPYLIPENNEPEDLSILPQNQFGFVTSINVFEYFSFDKIRHYLEEVWKILRPGGVFLFTYNNGERYRCAQLAENGTVSYIPKTMLVTFCETHGYEVLETFDLDNTVCWIEIRKPGNLKTVKTHQAMGEIKFK